ncbi:acylphosphatase [Methylophaga sp. OBS4]|uniref:acylphosphatase n=1 Tax=Methylophaga sp. OBS4 TaxID=2991935 RepID=UPI0022542227|nr:acylphosphatase [Methylophaga sp. OBS4]MCX4187439.1 acylphosphatase [Methylophaga sp. OBS4]
MGIKRYHLLVNGRVQGVSYRMAAWEQAQRLDVTGWVRNRADGRVEMLIEGETASLNALIAWAKQGPRFANVAKVDITEKPATGEFTDFEIH